MNLKDLISKSIDQNFVAKEETMNAILESGNRQPKASRRTTISWFRKPIAIAATLALIMASSIITLFAQNMSKTTKLQLSAPATAYPGDQVELKVEISELSSNFKAGVVGLTMDISYDDNVLDYDNAIVGLMAGKENFSVNANKTAPGEITVLIYADNDTLPLSAFGKGEVFKLPFIVKSGAQPGTAQFTATNFKLADYTEDESGFELVDVTNSTETATMIILSPTVINVDVSWGSMQFEYDMGTWNPGTHQYDNQGWTCGTDDNKITVTNRSNVPVAVSYEYEKEADYKEINGRFFDNNNSPVENAITLDAGDESEQSVAVYLKLENKPNKDLSGAKIGTVTVTITDESE